MGKRKKRKKKGKGERKRREKKMERNSSSETLFQILKPIEKTLFATKAKKKTF